MGGRHLDSNPLSMFDSFFVFPLFLAIWLRQNSSFLFSYTERIVLRPVIQLPRSTSQRFLLKLLSAARARHRTGRQSASNQGVRSPYPDNVDGFCSMDIQAVYKICYNSSRTLGLQCSGVDVENPQATVQWN